MTSSMYGASVPVFVRQLTALGNCLGKAEAHCTAKKIDPNALLQARLYPDMFTLLRQVQVAADFAKNTVARLAGVEPPQHENNEATFGDLRARIAKSLDYVKSVAASQIDGSDARDITLQIGGNPRTFKGADFLHHFAMTNFYFHVTTAYAIMRHNGVEIGKRDFIGAT